MNCPKCNAKLEDNAIFCSNCGAEIPAQRKNSGAGVSIGDKNVIAGDVSITNVNAQDETKLVNECHVCGKHVTNDQGHTCPECGQFTCNECFDNKKKMCDSCVKEKHKVALDKYQSFASKIYAKGAISAEDRGNLKRESESLGLSNEEVISIENSFRNDSNDLTDADKIVLNDCIEFLLNGEYEKAKEIESIHEKYPDNSDVFACYVRFVARSDDYDNEEVEKLITQKLQEYDSKGAQMTLVELALINEDLSKANRLIETAKKKWPFDYLVTCYEIILYCLFVNKKQRFEYLTKIHDALENLGQPTNNFEESCGEFTKYLCDWIVKWKNGEDEEPENDFAMYWGKLWIVDYSQTLKTQIEVNGILDDIMKEDETCKSALSSAGFSFGKYIDNRDKNEYKTITIGSQMWMIESLRYTENLGLCSLGQGVDDNKDFQNPDYANNTYTWAATMRKNEDKISLPLVNRIVNSVSALVLFVVIGKMLSFFSNFETTWDYILYFLLSIIFVSLITYLWFDGYSHLGMSIKDNNGKKITDKGKLVFALGSLPVEILMILVAFKFNEYFWIIWLLGSALIGGIAYFTTFWAYNIQLKISKDNRNSIAPEGWKIPTKKDLDILCKYINQLFEKKQRKIKKVYSSELELLAKALTSELCKFENFWVADYMPLYPDYIFGSCKTIGKIDYCVDKYGITEFGVCTPYTEAKYIQVRNDSKQKDWKCRVFCIKK